VVRAGARLDVELQFVLDWDLILRFLRVGAIVRHVPDLYGIFRIHPAQKTQSRLDETGRAEMRRVRADYGDCGLRHGRAPGSTRVTSGATRRRIAATRRRSMAADASVTVAVPSYNQGRYLDAALASIFEQGLAVEVYVADAGSTDSSIDVIRSGRAGLPAGAAAPIADRPRRSTRRSRRPRSFRVLAQQR